MYALVENNIVMEFPINSLRERFPNTSFSNPVKPSQFPAGIVKVEVADKPQAQLYHIVQQEIVPVISGDKCVLNWAQAPMSPEEIAQFDTEVSSTVRGERDRLLSESDWTQLQDSPVVASSWVAYRQALRDITSQDGFPHSVVWPVKP